MKIQSNRISHFHKDRILRAHCFHYQHTLVEVCASSADGRSSGQYQMTASATIYCGISGSCASTYCVNVYYYRKWFDM